MKKFGSITAMALFVAGGVFACSSSSNDDNNGGGGSGGTASGGSTASGGMNAGSGGAAVGGSGGGASGGMGMAGAGGAAGGTPVANVQVASDFTCPAGMQWGDPLPPQAMRKLTLVKDGLQGGEGGIWVESQKALFISDLQRVTANGQGTSFFRMASSSKIWKHTPENNMTVEWLPMGGVNGMTISADGMSLIIANIADRNVTAVNLMTKEKTKVVDKYMNETFNVTNDVIVRSDGHIYFTDPLWQAEIPGKSAGNPPAGSTKVYHAKPDGTVSVVDADRTHPNGAALSPDGRTLYVGAPIGPEVLDAGNWVMTGKLWKYAVAADGSTGPAQEFASGFKAPDGITVDCAGNVYVGVGGMPGEGGIMVFKSDGTSLGKIAIPDGVADQSVTNVAFGGTDRKTLFATTDKSLSKITLNVPGPN